MKIIIRFFFLIFLSITFTSCAFIVTTIMGLHNPSHKSNSQIDHAIVKLHIPNENTFVLDTSFENFSVEEAQYNGAASHDHLQPLQVSVYDSKGKLISFHINCYANGLFNLNWNSEERFNYFPPKTAAPLDSSISRSKNISMIRDYKTGLLLTDNFREYDYLFIVYWNLFMKKQSKRLIKFIEKYRTLHADQKIKIIYVNNDNLYN